jgi:hypothetical protein
VQIGVEITEIYWDRNILRKEEDDYNYVFENFL